MKGQQGKKKSAAQAAQGESYTLTDLEQIRVLADPLRLRILECFCQQERTTKQVADLLGEKPTKLYHHVDALRRIGLIRMTRTQQNRGTLEKYFLSVARRFEADPGLFSAADRGSEGEVEALSSMVSAMFGTTTRELSDLISRGGSARIKDQGLLSFLSIHISNEELRVIRDKLKSLLESVAETCKKDSIGDSDSPKERYRLTLALFPLDRDET